MTALDPTTRELLTAFRNALDAGVDRHILLEVLDGMLLGAGTVAQVRKLLASLTARAQEIPLPGGGS